MREFIAYPGIAALNLGVTSILKELPLEQCQLERNSITGEIGWRAPENYSFKVTGQFVINSDQSDVSYWSRPQDSFEILQIDNPEVFKKSQDIAEELGENVWDVFVNELNEEEYGETRIEPQHDFYGKWVVVSPNIDGSDSLVDYQLGSRDAILKVKEDVDTDYDAFCERVFDLNPESEPEGRINVMFTSDQINTVWIQRYAEPVVNKSKIELVEFTEKTKEFQRLNIKREEGIILPYDKIEGTYLF